MELGQALELGAEEEKEGWGLGSETNELGRPVWLRGTPGSPGPVEGSGTLWPRAVVFVSPEVGSGSQALGLLPILLRS